jgi:MoaA/NifB/PqqE/SkfB family radical SAM enzyme
MNPNNRYGFYGRLSEAFPSQVIVDVSEICNLACIHCPHTSFKESKYYSKSLLDPKLNEKMVEEVRTFGAGKTQYIRYTSNGEPLTHPKIYEMLTYAKKHSGTTVALTTNGKLFTKANVIKLLDTEVDVIDVSIDAFNEETYQKIRVGGKLAPLVESLNFIINEKREKKYHTKLVVSYVEQPLNLNETSDFENFWKKQGADYVVIRRLHSAAGCNPDIAQVLNEKNKNVVRKPCVYPWERIVVGPTGGLAFCPADWTHGSLFVDYNKTTIRETWVGEFYNKLREAHLKNDFKKHSFCGQCPDWSVIKWPSEGRSYASMIEDFQREGADVQADLNS